VHTGVPPGLRSNARVGKKIRHPQELPITAKHMGIKKVEKGYKAWVIKKVSYKWGIASEMTQMDSQVQNI